MFHEKSLFQGVNVLLDHHFSVKIEATRTNLKEDGFLLSLVPIEKGWMTPTGN